MADLYRLSQYFLTTLSVAGGIDASQTTDIVLQAVTGIDEPTKPGIALLNYSDPLETSACEWITYTSVNTTTKELQGVVRGQEDYSAKAHANGVTVAFPLSKSHINNIVDKLEGLDTGVTLDTPTLTSPTVTSPTITGTPVLNADSAVPFYNSSLSRQALINGNFDVWQRGTSVAVPDGGPTFQADRWYDAVAKDSGTLPTLTRSRQALTAGDISNSFYTSRLATNGAGTSLGTNSYHYMGQKIEHGNRLLCGLGKKVTISFWAKSDIANKKLGYHAIQGYGTGGSPTAAEVINGDNITLTSTWTKYTHTFTTNTIVGKTFGTANDDSFEIRFVYMWGSGTTAGRVNSTGVAETYVGSGFIDIAQVQLCAGDVALPFQPKSFEEELRACQRFCQGIQARESTGVVAQGIMVSASAAYVHIPHFIPMRAVPTLTATAADWKCGFMTGTLQDVTNLVITSAFSSERFSTLTVTCASGLTTGYPAVLTADGTNTRFLVLEAEL